MFNTHQIQVLKDLIEDAHIANHNYFGVKDKNFAADLVDIEIILESLEEEIKWKNM
jgi:hypothetical protein